MKEYACTSAPLREQGYDEDYKQNFVENVCPVPEPPAGSGWRYLDSVVHDGRVLWFWERTTPLAGKQGKV